MYIFGWDMTLPGCFIAFGLKTGGARGAFLKFGDGTEIPDASGTDPIVFTQISMSQREKYSHVECFNDTVHTYAFGFSPGASTLAISGVGFLVTGQPRAIDAPKDTKSDSNSGKQSKVIQLVNGLYKKNRLYENQKMAKIQIGSNILSGFLVGVDIAPGEGWNLVTYIFTLRPVKVQDNT